MIRVLMWRQDPGESRRQEGARIVHLDRFAPFSPHVRRESAALTALTIAVLLVVWINEAANLFLSRIDTLTYYVPWYSFLGERLRDGAIPGWLPTTMSGVPFAGDPQSGWGYFPAMVLMTLIPGAAGFKALILFHLLLAAGASYAFARLIGLNIAGSLVAASVFTFPGMLERVRCCTIHVQVAVWIPVAMIGIELAARQRTWTGRAVWWAVTGIAASQMIAGWIGQGAAYGLLTIAAYAGYRIVLAPPDDQRDWKTRLRLLLASAALIGVVAMVLSATAVLPRLDVVDRSNLSGGSYAEVSESAARTGGWSVAQLVDRLLTEEQRQGRWYIGSAALALAILAPVFARRRFQLSFFIPFGLVVLVLILRETLLHRLLYLIPSFRQFHEHRQDRILTIFPLVLAVMAGAVVATLPRWRGNRRMALFVLVPPLLAFAVRVWQPDDHDPISWYSMAAVVIVSALLGVALLVPRPRAFSVSAALLILTLIWDPAVKELALQENRGVPSIDAAVQAYQEVDPASSFLRDRMESGEVFRYFGYDPAWLTLDGEQRTYHIEYRDPHVLALIVNNRSIPLGLEDIQGYNPIQIQRYADFLERINGSTQSYHAANVLFRGVTSPLLNLLNVRYVILPSQIPPGRPDLLHLSQRYPVVYEDDQVRIVERTDSLPRAWIVHTARSATDEAALDLLQTRAVDPGAEAILPAGTSLPPLATPADPAVEQVSITGRTPDRITLQVEMNAPGLVVLSEIWDPDWQVTIDGQPAELFRADTILRAVSVPAGSHTVELSYRSTTLLVSAAVSGAAWLTIVLGSLALLLRRLVSPGRVRARHDQELDGFSADRTDARWAGAKPGALIDPPGASIESGNAESKSSRSVPLATLRQRGVDKRGSLPASGEIRPEP